MKLFDLEAILAVPPAYFTDARDGAFVADVRPSAHVLSSISVAPKYWVCVARTPERMDLYPT